MDKALVEVALWHGVAARNYIKMIHILITTICVFYMYPVCRPTNEVELDIDLESHIGAEAALVILDTLELIVEVRSIRMV